MVDKEKGKAERRRQKPTDGRGAVAKAETAPKQVPELANSDLVTRRITEQKRATIAHSDNFSETARKLAQLTWPKSVTENLVQNLRPWSAMTESMRIDADRFDAAARLAKEMQSSAALGASLAKLSRLGVESGIASELKRLQQSMAVFRPDPQLDRIARSFAASLEPYHSQFQALSRAIEAATEALKPHADVFQRAAEEERVAQFILELGFVPHDELWGYIADIDPAGGERSRGFCGKACQRNLARAGEEACPAGG